MNALFSTQFDAIVRQARRSANVVTLAKRRTNILNAIMSKRTHTNEISSAHFLIFKININICARHMHTYIYICIVCECMSVCVCGCIYICVPKGK